MDENKIKKWKLVNFCENDKFAIKSYCAIHNVDESLNLGDITKVDETKLADFNLMTWGFPCTDISIAGKQKGFIDENNKQTRSGLYYEGIRILRYKKPALSIIENVKNLTSKKFKKEFEMILSDLDEAGYNSYWKVLNAKNYGVPQNRERLFIVSIRKDLDNGNFVFPEGYDNGIRLKDILENNVDEKYYVSNEKTKKFLSNMNLQNIIDNSVIDPQGRKNKECVPSEIVPTLRSESHGNPPLVIENNYCNNQSSNFNETNNIKFIGNYNNSNYGGAYGGGVFGVNNISITLNVMGGGDHQPHIIEYNTQKENMKIRKLTPKECFRLMGFHDYDYEKASKVVSNTQLYKQAGNSIVVNVLYYIFAELYKAMPYLFDDLKLSSFFSGIGAFENALDMLYWFV